MTIGNWYRVGTVAVQNGSANVIGTGTFWTSQCNPGDRFTVDGENWYEVFAIISDTQLTLQSVGGSGAFAGATGANLAYAIDRNFTNNLNANIAASVASLVAQYQANSNGPLSGLFQNGAAATPGIAFLAEASTGWFHPAAGIAALAVQGAEVLRTVGTAAGVPAMLGIGQVAPANALDLLTTNNTLYGARIQNSSSGTAARAALQLGNGAQVLNVGVNGANFTANGVLTAARGFVEGPSGIDFASGVTAGNAFTWGTGVAYASKMALDYLGHLGVGVTPSPWNAAAIDIGSVVGISSSTTEAIFSSNIYLNAAANAWVAKATGASAIYTQNNGIHVWASAPSVAAGSTAVPTSYMTLLPTGQLGIGMTPGNLLDMAQNTAGQALAQLQNTNTAGEAGLQVTNGTAAAGLFMIGTSRATYGVQTPGSGGLYVGSSQTLFVAADGGGPITFGTGLGIAYRGGFDGSGNFLVGNAIGSSSFHAISKPGTTEGNPHLTVAGVATIYQGSAVGANAAACVISLTKNSTTSRSINAAGTLNATGADYAEYRQLIAPLYGAVAKGALLGYDANGLMTNLFADVVGRVLPKSTNPSYVGGDTWGSTDAIVAVYGVAAPGDQPAEVFESIAPTVVADPGPDATDEQANAYAAYLAVVAALPAQQVSYAAYQTAEATYQTNLAAFNAALETERVKWDRIALCGVVPVNIMGLTAADIGKYLVPCAASDGTITAMAVAKADLTLGQYIDSFGSIEAIGADGRPLVNVKNG